MATSYRQLALQRKLIYLGVVIALFCGSLVWRRLVVEPQANRLALREQNMGEVELAGVIVRHALIGSRGFVTCAMWMDAIELKKKNKWNELELTTRALTQLQPHMISPWQFQCWNLTFNVSVESDRIRDKYYWVTRGILLMAEGERQNRFSPMLRRDIGSFQEFKICRSDENNVMRSLFQLSCIPPKDRNPDLFWVRNEKGEIKRLPDGSREVDLEAFRKFCREHPQLIRRLAAPPLVNDPRREWPRYQVANVQEVIEFLDENRNVPSLFADKIESEERYNERQAKAKLEERFPVLPPARDRPYPDYPGEEWTDENILVRPRDHMDAFHVARAWYGYAQELLPPPHPEIPDESAPITDPINQRIPKKMATVIFRMSPGLAQRHVAERLAEEGWFDQEPWKLNLPYQRGRIGKPGKNVEMELREEHNWSQQAWNRSYTMWKNYGERNHLLLSENEKKNKEADAERYAQLMKKAGRDPHNYFELMAKDKDPLLDKLRKSALFLFNYSGARSKTNFDNHYHQSQVEAQGAGPGKENETVLARKAFYEAERIRRNTLLRRGALKKFDEGAVHWREVLKNNPRFQEYTEVDRETVEIELKYVRQYADLYGRETKELLALQNYLGQAMGGGSGVASWTSLGLATTPSRMPTLVIYGPFAEDENGESFYSERQRKSSLEQLKLSEKAATIRKGRADPESGR